MKKSEPTAASPETPVAKPRQQTREELKAMDRCDKILLSLATQEERIRTLEWLYNAHGIGICPPLAMLGEYRVVPPAGGKAPSPALPPPDDLS